MCLLSNNWYFASPGSKTYKYVLSISGWRLINILYEWSGTCDQYGLCYFIFSFVISSNLITFVLLDYIVTFNFLFFTWYVVPCFICMYFYWVDWLHCILQYLRKCFLFLWRLWSCLDPCDIILHFLHILVSRNHTKSHTLLFYLVSILKDLKQIDLFMSICVLLISIANISLKKIVVW